MGWARVELTRGVYRRCSVKSEVMTSLDAASVLIVALMLSKASVPAQRADALVVVVALFIRSLLLSILDSDLTPNHFNGLGLFTVQDPHAGYMEIVWYMTVWQYTTRRSCL